MVSSKQKRHFIIKHPSLVCKDVNFRRLMEHNKNETTYTTSSVRNSEKVQKVYEVAQLIVKAKRPCTVGQTLLTLACIRMLEIVKGPDGTKRSV